MAEELRITVKQVRERADDQSYQRGQEYYKSGAILDPVRRGNELEAYCEGSEPNPYRVKAMLGSRGITKTSCTCPYDWGGDCKHIVALLLTYIHNPDAFTERPPLEEVLAARSQEELIALIRELLARQPDLEILINRPQPGHHPRQTPVNTDSFRQEIRHAVNNYEGWGDSGPEDAVVSIIETADRFAEQGDWPSARAIYSTALDEGLENAFIDEEGDFITALDGAVDGLVACLGQPSIADNDAERHAALDSLLGAYFWSLNQGFDGPGEDLPDPILAHARRSDLPDIRKLTQEVLERQRKREYGEWAVEAYEDFLAQIDELDDVDPEVILARLRERGQYRLLFEKLLQAGRGEEAIAVTAEYMLNPYERFQAVIRLADTGYGDAAIRLADEALQTRYDDNLAAWLLEQYQERRDREAVLRLQRKRMDNVPNEANYAALQEAAEALDQWADVRPKIVNRLQKEKHFEVLARVYLHEEDWDAAWETLEKAKANPRERFWLGYEDSRLELEVAERSRLARPHQAIAVYVKHARREIDQRSRDHYNAAAGYLSIVRDLYRQIKDEGAWQALIGDIRTQFQRLPALQDELNKARL